MSKSKTVYTVFISSTFLDNEERRKTVEDAVLRAGMAPIGMEHFSAVCHPTVDECQRQARDCDVYLGIVAHRYGWIPEGQAVSITELEYDAAKDAKRARFLFEVDSKIPVDLHNDFDQGPDRWAKQDKLDAFRSKYRQDQMPTPFTDTSLGAKVLHALNRWREEREGYVRPEPAPRFDTNAARKELDRYRDAIISLHSSLPLTGFKTKLRVPIDLEELYVPLKGMLDLRGTGDSVFADACDAETKLGAYGLQDIPLIEACREARKRKRRGLVILGDPGSGKTTHLKRLLLACLQEDPASLGLPSETLPVFLPLRELDDLNQGIEAFIQKTLDSPHLAMAEGFGGRLLERGHLLLLFDGLDEVSDPGERARVAHWIKDAAKARPNCTAVVTCRFAGYDEQVSLGADFLELHLRPLSREQAEKFIRNWYRAVECGLAHDPAQGQITARQRSEELIGRLAAPDFRSARMTEMTRNPLLLTNLCLVHRDRGALPKGRHRLYDECIEVLMERWREGKELSVNVSAAVGRRVLQPAALWLHAQEGRTRASAEELAPILEPALKASPWRGGDARTFLRTVMDDSGLLTGWGPEHYGFMHLGFQEYLAACELRRLAFEGDKEGVLEELASHYGGSWWQEVILMLLAQGNPSLFTPFMRRAMQQPRFTSNSELLGFILEEAAEASADAFIDWLQTDLSGSAPASDPSRRQMQLNAVYVLKRLLGEAESDAIIDRLMQEAEPSQGTWLQTHPLDNQATRTTPRGNVELVRIGSGRFIMGSPKGDGNACEHPAHDVCIQAFYLGRYPVTNEQYGRFLLANPDVREPVFWGDRRLNQARQPVVGVSWDDAQHFAAWSGGRLPTEAEWEYAARAGSTSAYFWGKSADQSASYAWHGENSQGVTHPVGEKQPNGFGLYDTAGNVWEWVQDRWHDGYHCAPEDGLAWDAGNRCQRVIRGGSWYGGQKTLRSAYRGRNHPDLRDNNLGFRIAQNL